MLHPGISRKKLIQVKLFCSINKQLSKKGLGNHSLKSTQLQSIFVSEKEMVSEVGQRHIQPPRRNGEPRSMDEDLVQRGEMLVPLRKLFQGSNNQEMHVAIPSQQGQEIHETPWAMLQLMCLSQMPQAANRIRQCTKFSLFVSSNLVKH